MQLKYNYKFAFNNLFSIYIIRLLKLNKNKISGGDLYSCLIRLLNIIIMFLFLLYKLIREFNSPKKLINSRINGT